MTDYFALLSVARSPWLEEETLKKSFLRLSGETHPDRVHQEPRETQDRAGERATEINAAYVCLREPKTRLQHFLELENGVRPTDLQDVPGEMTEFFFTVSALNREVDGFLAEKNALTSPLLKLQLFERNHDYVERLQSMLQKVEARTNHLASALRDFGARWPPASGSPEQRKEALRELENLYRLFGFHARWAGSLRERIGRLSFPE